MKCFIAKIVAFIMLVLKYLSTVCSYNIINIHIKNTQDLFILTQNINFYTVRPSFSLSFPFYLTQI